MKRKGFISSILIIALLTSMFACMFTVHAVTGNAGETVYIRTTNGTPTCYMWLDASGSTSQNAAWPGVKMTEVETNIYAFTLDKSYDKVFLLITAVKQMTLITRATVCFMTKQQRSGNSTN